MGAVNSRVPNNEQYKAIKTVAFDGSAGNGAIGTVNLFTVTGDVYIEPIVICTESLVGATATISFGTAGSTAVLTQGNVVLATDIVNGMGINTDVPSIGVDYAGDFYAVNAGADIIATVADANITNGTLLFYIFWRPLSSNGNVVAA